MPPRLGDIMKLEQGQIWKQGRDYYRIVVWERLRIEYKIFQDLEIREGTHHVVTKKEFCRLIKGAQLIPAPAATPPAA
jgi:hypothetical protein